MGNKLLKGLYLVLGIVLLVVGISYAYQMISYANPDRTRSEKPKMDEEIKALTYNFEINQVDPKKDLYYLEKPRPVIPDNTYVDDQNVAMFKRNGKVYNHPVRLAHHTLYFINSYQMTKNEEYIKQAERYTQRLADIAVYEDDSMFFPYDFDVKLHGIETERFDPSWYSAMAQGQALSAFARLYELTEDAKYLEWADKTYNSLIKMKKGTEGGIWVSRIDKNGYLWLEEYPLEDPTMVLNGKIFAIAGIYDYYQVKKNPLVKKYLTASITTTYDHVEEYRLKDDVSKYGLKHDHQSKYYHGVHIDQLNYLYDMTKDEYFKEMAEAFFKDYHPEKPPSIKDRLSNYYRKVMN
ncbi:AGE family epimerase/isomerase [Hazenella sp. IB182353]|uniref:D-glucuronyl C5-epimerase family protein n=1 Tax=Polycladospora coralii TaxID=2771432 RepID=UPI00174683BE|nr:D-glucuronyl C5-epimerase family protein [Polycladospora coralii]MBS7530769.1 AGE family epimerase/isomerase [Polycladospora coralii]